MRRILEKFKNLFSNKFIYKPKKKSIACTQETSKPEEKPKEQKQ